eukprot:scaffold319173_cov35-Tisochrysis_lutea.AAC.1
MMVGCASDTMRPSKIPYSPPLARAASGCATASAAAAAPHSAAGRDKWAAVAGCALAWRPSGSNCGAPIRVLTLCIGGS